MCSLQASIGKLPISIFAEIEVALRNEQGYALLEADTSTESLQERLHSGKWG